MNGRSGLGGLRAADIIVERCAIDGRVKSTSGSTESSVAALRTVMRTEGPGDSTARSCRTRWFGCHSTKSSSPSSARSRGGGVEWRGPERLCPRRLNTFAAAAGASFATNPIDVVKTRLQVSGANPGLFDYKGPVDCS